MLRDGCRQRAESCRPCAATDEDRCRPDCCLSAKQQNASVPVDTFTSLRLRAALCAGTHDNETMVGWWKGVQDKEDPKYIQLYTDQKKVTDIAWTTIRLACRSVSQTCIFQMQVLAWPDQEEDAGPMHAQFVPA